MTYYLGLVSGNSKEEKPECPDGWSFIEIDTGVAFLKADGKWKKDKQNPFLKLFKIITQEVSIQPES